MTSFLSHIFENIAQYICYNTKNDQLFFNVDNIFLYLLLNYARTYRHICFLLEETKKFNLIEINRY
jgi:hypothetical protein